MLAALVALSISLCAPHPLHPPAAGAVICERKYSQFYADEALCERAADRDGDGRADPLWDELTLRLAEAPGQFLELRCPLRAYRTEPVPETP